MVDGSGAKMVAESSSCPERLPTLPKDEESTSHISIAAVNGSGAFFIKAPREFDDSQTTHDLPQEDDVGDDDGDGDDEEKAERPASADQVQCGTSTAAVKFCPRFPPFFHSTPSTPHMYSSNTTSFTCNSYLRRSFLRGRQFNPLGHLPWTGA